MVNKNKTYLLTIGFFIFFTNSFCQINNNSSNELTMLKNFYTAYITELSSPNVNYKHVDSLKKIYCTKGLIGKMKSNELDYDILLNAQDSDIEWLKTLTVKKTSFSTNQFDVSFIDNYSKKKNIIKVAVVKQGGGFKISEVLK